VSMFDVKYSLSSIPTNRDGLRAPHPKPERVCFFSFLLSFCLSFSTCKRRGGGGGGRDGGDAEREMIRHLTTDSPSVGLEGNGS